MGHPATRLRVPGQQRWLTSQGAHLKVTSFIMADDHASSNAPYILLFRADHHFFCLDKHTNRTFLLSETEAHILERWLRGARLEDLASQYPIEVGEIRQLMNEGVFCSLLPHGLQYSSHWDEICQRILHERSQTILEITQSCNLRCKYHLQD